MRHHAIYMDDARYGNVILSNRESEIFEEQLDISSIKMLFTLKSGGNVN